MYYVKRTRRQCPELTAVNVDVFRCNPGLGVSRHPPVIRFRQAFKGLRRGNTNATVPVFSLLLLGRHAMDLSAVCFALLGWFLSFLGYEPFLSFHSFVTISCLSRLCYISIPIGSFLYNTYAWMAFDIVRDAVLDILHARLLVCSRNIAKSARNPTLQIVCPANLSRALLSNENANYWSYCRMDKSDDRH
ncbi:hypothetical protein FOXG_17919 [Fusarium oxysporum f. sp. lycopersici 4287]|uniref:Uncharacterized protein n=2 Tax=Fusarium oxysporum TaxID=5507 RepID=A0A0J9U743_FUSO4|nr:hypothetical protein FOXG_17919 [Fusarium oxysporum f. sp. lycopersici 4287]EXK48476.1 hypothetical protein FOMG_01389 [Fusarium oxysporum f. sp. melonis 26406]KNA94799.1 hypothetical protein FOXG_17919 [Fusarium oxysporum f. sp. lycopersici 4287]